MIVRNKDVKEITVEIPEGHKHIRTTIVFNGGKEITLQEAAVANLVRAFITVKTHPRVSKIKLKSQKLEERKDGYDTWQLLETNGE